MLRLGRLVSPALSTLGCRSTAASLHVLTDLGNGLVGRCTMAGLAFGTGSAVAHRTVDAVMGPRTVQHEMVGGPAAEKPVANAATTDICSIHPKAFQDWVNNFGSDVSKCQFYMDMSSEFRKNNGSMLSA